MASWSRRTFVKVGIAAAPIRALSAGRTRPNILFLMADQHRADCVGAEGNHVIKTPNLDLLANEGVRFRCAYTCTPSCTPARAALLSGLAPWRNGLLGYTTVPEKYPTEMPQALRDAGYYTTGIGKMHWHPQRNAHGFHRMLLDESGRELSPDFRSDYRAWFMSEAPGLDPDATGIGWNDYRSAEYALPEKLHPTRWTADCAVRFIDSYKRPEPFFLKVSFARPHSPYDPPQRFMKQYENAALPKASVGAWAKRFEPKSDSSFNIWHGDEGAEQVRRSRQGYYGSVSFVDEQIGRILETLEKRGLLEETLIVYTSDHGDMTGDHHLWRKTYGYEASARIPLIVRSPKGFVPDAQRGRTILSPVELRDILPTFLEAAEDRKDRQFDGRSLLPLVRGAKTGWRQYIDLEHSAAYKGQESWTGLTDGRSKYLYHARSGEEQLFNLQKDPNECDDLSGDAGAAADLRAWRSRMIAHLEPRGEAWVKGGKLQLRAKPTLRSPAFVKS